MSIDRCCMCGAIVPEGTMVCTRCMKKTQMEDKRYALLPLEKGAVANGQALGKR